MTDTATTKLDLPPLSKAAVSVLHRYAAAAYAEGRGMEDDRNHPTAIFLALAVISDWLKATEERTAP